MSRIIGAFAQRKVDGAWQDMDTPIFKRRENDYDLFCFLGCTLKEGVVPPIASSRGLPTDYVDAAIFADAFDDCSYLTITELVAFDYDKVFEECRTSVEIAPKSYVPGRQLPSGRGTKKSIRDLLGPCYFEDVDRLRREGAGRIIFGFA